MRANALDVLKEIFTLEIHDEQDKFEMDQFVNAVSARFQQVTSSLARESESQVEDFHPGMAWIVFKGWNEEYLGSNKDWWVQKAIQEQVKEYSSDTGDAISLQLKEPSTKELSEMGRALNLLEKIWPEAHRQINRYVKRIILLEGNNFESGTAAYAFGAVFINPGPDWNSIKFMDILLHESGHLSLMVKQTFGRLIHNFQEKASSPLRKEERWLNGIIHAAFVIYRICYGLQRVKQFPQYFTAEELKVADQLLEENLVHFEKALGTLRDKAQFTDIGEHFMNQLLDSYEKLKSK